MKIVSYFILLVLLSSCIQSQNYLIHDEYYNSQVPSYVEEQNFYFLGLGQEKIINKPGKYCDEKDHIVSKVVTKVTPTQYFFTFITLSVYSPRTVEIYCLDPKEDINNNF